MENVDCCVSNSGYMHHSCIGTILVHKPESYVQPGLGLYHILEYIS